MNRLVALALPGGPDFATALRRIFDDGDAALPVDLRLALPARRRLLDLMRPAVLVEGPSTSDRTKLPDPLPVEPGDALVMATSGTTGEPKGVVLTHDAISASARAVSRRLEIDRRTDAWWACLPLAHVGGLSVLLRSWVEGVRCEVVGGFSGRGASDALDRGATLTSLVPTALGRLDPEVAAGFRWIVLGGSAPPAGLPENVVTTYGLTETGSGIVYDGLPLDGVEVRIASDGQIEVRGPMLLRAYRDGTGALDADGWFRTGDAGALGPDGRLQVHGRIGDMIISGGENVWPAAVEPLLERHPQVHRAAVCGRPDEEWGERVTAFVEAPSATEPRALLAELRQLVSSELSPIAAPRELVVVESLPTTGIGKVQRDSLAALSGTSARW